MEMNSSSVDISTLGPTSSVASSKEHRSKESSIRTNMSINDQDRTVNLSPLFTPSNSSVFQSPIQHVTNKSLSQTAHPSSTQNAMNKIDEMNTKQTELEEKIASLERTIVTRDLFDTYKTEMQKNRTHTSNFSEKTTPTILADHLTNLEELKQQYLAEQIFIEEKLDFFRLFMWRLGCDTRNWKILAHRIYRVQRLINTLDNHKIREPLQKQFKLVSDEFILFVKYLIAEQIKEQQSKKANASISSTISSNVTRNSTFDNVPHTTFQEHLNNINANEQIKSHLHNLESHIVNLRDSVLTAQQHVGVCRTGTDAMTTLIEAIDDIKLDPNHFVLNLDLDDQNRVRLLTLKQDLAQKSNKIELLQLKTYIDGQVKKLIELNKQNAEKLEQTKIMKNATPQARRVQAILANQQRSPAKSNTVIAKHRTSSFQSSRPYTTFDLDNIRQYQRQALLRSPYGTIPLYRRQAWAAANLFDGHPLHFLRHMQHSLRMQIHQLLGHNPADVFAICNQEKSGVHQRGKTKKRVDFEMFTTREDFALLGSDNKLYRGRIIDACQTVPLVANKDTAIVKQKESKTTTHRVPIPGFGEKDERNKIDLDDLDQTVKTIADETLFEYFDWQAQFDEQDLSSELCEDLFAHWKSVVCENYPCTCDSKSILIQCEEQLLDAVAQGDDQRNFSDNHLPQPNPVASTDTWCICSDCSCACDKHPECHNSHSICLCSQCSCKCLKERMKEFDNDTVEDQVEDRIETPSMKRDRDTLEILQPISELIVTDECQTEKNESRRFSDLHGEQSEDVSPSHVEEEDQTKAVTPDIYLSDCFANRVDRWTEQFDLFQGGHQSIALPEGYDWSAVTDAPPGFGQLQTSVPIAYGSHALSIDKNLPELDDPTAFRQQILDHHQSRPSALVQLSSINESIFDQIEAVPNQHVPNRRTIQRRQLSGNTSLDLLESKHVSPRNSLVK